MPEPFKPQVYTPSTLAERWSCSERHVRNMIDNGELPAFRLGEKLLRIRAADVEAFELRSDTSSDPVAIEQSKIPLSEPKKRRTPVPRLDRGRPARW